MLSKCSKHYYCVVYHVARDFALGVCMHPITIITCRKRLVI